MKNLGNPQNASQSGYLGSYRPYLRSALLTDKTCLSSEALQPSQLLFTHQLCSWPCFSLGASILQHNVSLVCGSFWDLFSTSLCNQTHRTAGATIVHPTSVPEHWRTYFLSNIAKPHNETIGMSHWSCQRTAENPRDFISRLVLSILRYLQTPEHFLTDIYKNSSHSFMYYMEVLQSLSPFSFLSPFSYDPLKNQPMDPVVRSPQSSLSPGCLPVQRDLCDSATLALPAWSETQFPGELLFLGLLLSLYVDTEDPPLVLGFGCTALSICCRYLAITFLYC